MVSMNLEINNILLSAETSFLQNLNMWWEREGLAFQKPAGNGIGANFGIMGKFSTFVAGGFRRYGIPLLF